jgi:hypothetical protein
MNYVGITSAMADAGLEDPRVLLDCGFKNSEELLAMLLPGVKEFAAGVPERVQALLDRAGEDARLRVMATRLDVTGGLEDALHAAKKVKRLREIEDMADRPAATSLIRGKLDLGIRRVPDVRWKPDGKKRKLVEGLQAKDTAAMAQWSTRLTSLMREGDTPAWSSIFDAGSPVAASAGLVGKQERRRSESGSGPLRSWQHGFDFELAVLGRGRQRTSLTISMRWSPRDAVRASPRSSARPSPG